VKTLDLSAAARIASIDLKACPAASVAAAKITEKGEIVLGSGAAGRLSFDDDADETTADTVFDLASVTKPFTALTLARLARTGKLERHETLAEVLPELAKTRSANVTMDLLSAHRAGLAAHAAIFEPIVRGEAVDRNEALLCAADKRRDECAGEPPREGFAPVYSDLGYLLLGAAIARRGGGALDEVIDRELIQRLGLSIGSARLLERRDPLFSKKVAPTEIVPFRGGLIRGVVHDENAFAISGSGLAGHAGLFGTALDVAKMGVFVLEALLGRSDLLEPQDIEPMTRQRPGGSELAGFDAKSGPHPSSGARLGPRTFGHLGFTGTSIWIDPDALFVGVLLTNRVHPLRTSLAIRAARPLVYDAMFDAMFS